jgi:mono/diheme cytochrome c family protein
MKKGVLVAASAVFLIGSIIAVGVLKYGIVPVNADVPPSALEMQIFPAALRASVARRAGEQPGPAASSNENLIAGAEIYREMCARCHGLPGKGPSVLGSSFYPPAPQLALHPTEYSEAEIFWIVKHGIRNTGMPAWGKLLSDQDISQVVAMVRRLDSPPPAAEAALREQADE